jgi:hypothetical protein
VRPNTALFIFTENILNTKYIHEIFAPLFKPLIGWDNKIILRLLGPNPYLVFIQVLSRVNAVRWVSISAVGIEF